MKRLIPMALAVAVILVVTLPCEAGAQQGAARQVIKLPEPALDGGTSVEKAISQRRSVRAYKDEPLSMAEVGQLLWSAQGITEPSKGLRAAPSPRAAYLLQVYVLSGKVTGLPEGIYLYRPKDHELALMAAGDVKGDLFKAVGQQPIKAAPVAFVLTGDAERATNPRWPALEAGHAAENLMLQAVSLRLGGLTVAGFKDDDVKKALNLPAKEVPLYILPVGRK